MQTENEPSRKHNGHDHAIDMFGDHVDEWRERLSSIDTQLRTVARERPVAVICGALALGYFIGRVVR